MVSAPIIAKERGIKLSTTNQDKAGAFEGYIKVTVVTEKGNDQLLVPSSAMENLDLFKLKVSTSILKLDHTCFTQQMRMFPV